MNLWAGGHLRTDRGDAGSGGTAAPSGGGHGRGGAPSARRARLRRRRRWTRRRLDSLSSWVLGGLVALSLFLGVLLWQTTPPLPAPLLAGGGAAYVIGDALGTASVGTLLQPARVVLLYPGGPDAALGDPAGNPLFGTLWSTAQTLLRAVTPAEIGSARPASLEGVAAVLGTGRTAGGRSHAALEVDLGPRLDWRQWWDLFGGARQWPGGPGPVFDRAYFVPASSATEIFLLSGSAGLEISLPAAAGRALSTLLLAEQGQPQPSGYPVEPLGPVTGTTFGVAPGIEVPVAPAWGRVSLDVEHVVGDRFAASIFPDPLAVRVYRARGGTVTYSNPQHWVLDVSPDGAVSLAAPPLAAGAAAGQDWLGGLDLSIRYVGREGGWPPSAWLAALTPIYPAGGCTLSTCEPYGYQYAFETRYQGLPVIGQSPALAVTVAGAGVTAYSRRVPLAGSALPEPTAWIPARTVVDALERDPPPSLYSPPMVINDVYPAWAPLPLDGVLEPAWALRLEPIGGGGPARIVLVDALRGQVLAVLTGGGG